MRILSLLTLCFLPLTLLAADWPQWRGPERISHSKETGLLKTWPKDGPKLLWKSNQAGNGYAGMAVVKGVVYTMGARDKEEHVLALDDKGKELWSVKLGPVYDWKKGNSWSYGPNATPTVTGGRIYALSSNGMLKCVTTAGKEQWKQDLYTGLGGKVSYKGGPAEENGWGYSWSPLVDGDLVVTLPGGKNGLFAGIDARSGKVLWRSKDLTDACTYVSPIVATIAKTKQYIAVVQNGVVAVDSKGNKLWEHRRENDYPDVVCATPIVLDDKVIVSVGYGGGLDILKVTEAGGKFKVEQLEESNKRALNNKQGGVALVGKHLVGYHENRQWACVDVATGKNVWRNATPGLKEGGFVVADGRLYVLDEDGVVGMVEASPKKFNLISSFTLPEQGKNPKESGKIWAHPSLSDGKLYVRDQELIFCYDVKGK